MHGGGRAVPADLSRPALALGATAFALFGIARTTGSGWLIVILTGIASVVALAAVLPWFGLRRVLVDVGAPRDATVGRTVELDLELGGGGTRPVKVRVLGFDAPWTGAVTPCRGRLAVVPLRRGVVEAVTIEVRSGAPLGLVWWRRRVVVPLLRPLAVGPFPLDARAPAAVGRRVDGQQSSQSAPTLADAVRSVRDYVPGDPIKLVHWAATARFGELMVKELESPVAPTLVLAVDLRGADEYLVEDAAARAAGVALAALRDGVPVLLLTAEKTGPRSGPVGSALEVGRRLAYATAGPLPAPPHGVEPLVIRAGEAVTS